MITIQVTNKHQHQQFEHAGGPIEFGRGPKRKVERFVINDLFASRDQLRVEELSHNKIVAENLSSKQEVALADGSTITIGTKRELVLPVRLVLGQTYVDVLPVAAETFDQGSLSTVDQPMEGEASTVIVKPLKDLGDRPAPEMLAHWLETVIRLQRSAGGSPDFHDQTARALVDLIGLDEGLVLLRRDFNWEIVGRFPPAADEEFTFSRTLLSHVAAERRTFYQDLKKWASSESLRGIEAVVVSPIFGNKDEVIGALYGVRRKEIIIKGGIKPLEAQVVQLLAANIGANVARVIAVRTRAQLDQFFSPAIVQELERDPKLLDGRDQEVTLLAARLEGYADLTKRMGADSASKMARDLMDHLSERIGDQNGVVVELTGDGLLAMWNAPLAQHDHALMACGGALGMMEELPDFNGRWKEQAGGPLHLTVVLHTGMALVGNLGSSQRFKYRPHGPIMDLIRRLQDATRKLGRPVLMTGGLQDRLPDTLATRRLCQARFVPGGEPIPIYELHGVAGKAEWIAKRDAYESALMQYEFGQWSRACSTLMPILQQGEKQDVYDAPALQLMRRACNCLESMPTAFDPAFDLTD